MSLVAIVLIVLLLALVLGGIGVHFLWFIAAVVLVVFLLGFLIGGPPAEPGARRRYYGRW